MVGQKHDGLSARRHLDGSHHDAFARQFLGARAMQRPLPLQPDADSVGVFGDFPCGVKERVNGCGGEPGISGAERDLDRNWAERRCRRWNQFFGGPRSFFGPEEE